MKTRFFAISALCVLALAASCQKAENELTPAAGRSSITAFIDEDTKTAYEGETTFGWVEGDKIGFVLYNVSSGAADNWSYTAESSGAKVVFGNAAEFNSDWEPARLALYPFGSKYSTDALSYSGNKADGLNVVMPELYTTTASGAMSHIPLLGVPANEEGTYAFKTATGVLKVSFSNVPATVRKVVLNTKDNVAGSFSVTELSAPDGIKMENATEATNSVGVSFPSVSDGNLTVFIPVPVGTVSAGATLSLQDANGEELFTTAPTTRNITVTRRTVTNITPNSPIAFVMADVDLTPLLGEYAMTVYGDGGLSGGYSEPGDIVLEASDTPYKGNVMMTKFAGVSGKVYGTFDGTYLVFSSEQIFGENTIPNPQVSASTYPYLALDFYTNTVVDPTFQLLETGKIKAVNANYFGFRATTEELWFSTESPHNGSWPWALSFNAITAVWKSIIEAPTTYVKGEKINLTVDMIAASDVCTHDGQGVPGLIDGDATTYWHSNWSYPVTKNDATYGIYFDITLEEAIDAIQFKYQVRNNNRNSRPTSVVYGVSTDGTNWTQVGTCANDDMNNAAAGDWVTLPAVTLSGSYKFIRFGINDSADTNEGSLTGDLSWSGSKKCTNMAELELWWAE